eukprot:3779297-Prymnesium_polylepis.1
METKPPPVVVKFVVICASKWGTSFKVAKTETLIRRKCVEGAGAKNAPATPAQAASGSDCWLPATASPRRRYSPPTVRVTTGGHALGWRRLRLAQDVRH